MSTYVVEFDRIGRDHEVPPLTVTGDDADEIAFAIYTYARPRLRSSDVEVAVNLDEKRATIFCGFHIGGYGTLTGPLA